MHGSSLQRMGWFVRNFLSGRPGPLRVLDVGSCEVAGGAYRQFFPAPDFEYIGLDMAPGPNVDIVPKLPYCWRELEDSSFDVVISGQAFEHMEFFWLAASEMARVLRPGGQMCVVAPRGFARHRFPVDCYRFDTDGMIAIARWCNLRPLHVSTDLVPPGAGPEWHIEQCEDSFLIAEKPAAWNGVANPAEYRFEPPNAESLAGDFLPCARAPEPEPEHAAELAEQAGEQYRRVIGQMAEELRHLRRRVNEYEGSRSWRVTAPLRKLGKMARGLKSRYFR